MVEKVFQPTDRPARRCWIGLTVTLLLFEGLAGFQGGNEEKTDSFKKWLTEDAVYIITDEEQEVFKGLTTPLEKERFIEQFWHRRDSDPQTGVNEFKEEHYRRVAYANEHFHSGIPGWKADRGRIYIMHGPPDEISGKPAGGTYVRPAWEGGGTTSVFPFEIWRYRYIEGVGSDIEIEFVDPHQSGEFRLARDPQEKDAALHIPNAGLTRAEAAGLTSKRDRIQNRYRADQYSLGSGRHQVHRLKDQPFERLLLQAQLEKPTLTRYRDLETIVRTQVSYQNLPLQSKVHYLYVSGIDVLAPLTFLIPNRELGFKPLPSGTHRATIRLYGEVWDVAKRVVYNFEDELTVDLTEKTRSTVLKNNSIFQRYIPLQPGRYVLKMVVKDLFTAKVSTADHLMVVPGFPEDSVSVSSIILAESIIPQDAASEPGMFTLGNFKVIPSVDYEFGPQDHVLVYFQLYQLGIDQQTLRPKIHLERALISPSDSDLALPNRPGIQLLSDGRMVVMDAIPAHKLEDGLHRLEYRIKDLVTGEELTATSSEFKISRTS